MRTILKNSLFSALLLVAASQAALAGDFFEADGAALHGYDVVSYFDSGKPEKGAAQHEFTYQGSKFLFATAAHRDRFAKDPEKFAPQFGGYCAYGTANDYKVPTQPDAFKVVDGKLYLNYDRKVLGIWSKDEPGNIARANENWPTVKTQPMKQ